MQSTETLLLTRQEVAALLTMEECITAVEHAFKLYATGKAPAPGTLGIHSKEGVFHTKAGIFNLSYALGKQFNTGFDLRTGKIHAGLTALF